MEKIALMLVLMLKFDRNPATDDTVAELLQFRRFFADSGFYRVGMWKTAKGYLYGYLHFIIPLSFPVFSNPGNTSNRVVG